MAKTTYFFLLPKTVRVRTVFAAVLMICAAGLIAAKDTAAQTRLTIAVVENAPIARTSSIIVEEAYRRLGIEVDFEFLPPKRALLQSNKGALDGETVRHPMVSRANKNLVRINVPIVHDEIFAYSIGQSGLIEKFSDLHPYRVGVLLGNHASRRLANHPGLITFRSPEQGVQMLLKKRLDFVLYWKRNFEKLKMNLKTAKQVRPSSKSLHTAQGFHFLHMKNKHLIGKVEKVLQEMWDDGFIDNVWNSS
jgi:hypothetical protein